MKIQHTFSPTTRALLMLTGLAGVASLMFFKDVSPVTSWLALAGIIPLIMGILGENLVLTLFTTTTPVAKNSLAHETAAVTTFPSVSHATDNLENKAA
ncbi:MAG: hypothetical protein QNL62_06860 [Gammaproteobacteria bacterium]|nr:hypothetical protein [Gammaproteobacteria bacterium]